MSTVLLRSTDYRVRLQVALFEIANARINLKDLNAEYLWAGDKFTRLVLGDRILATENFIKGWTDYINGGCPYEPRAQVTARTYAHLRKV